MKQIELKEDVKRKLAEAVELWADENLIGKPALLANALYFSLERAFIEDIKKIELEFGAPNENELSIGNAQLIAAAPDLLEVCQEAIIGIERVFINSEIVKKLRQAVAKATGYKED